MAKRTTGARATGKTKAPAFETRNDLSADSRSTMVALINTHVAATLDLMTQVKHAHWNCKGPQFIALHEMFDDLAEGLETHLDAVAERATALGGFVNGTVRMAATASQLEEFPAGVTDGLEQVRALSDRFAALAASVRDAIDAAEDADDKGTADLFTDMVRDLDKYLWFLEAHLQS
jgi:starvation-inducible DNA-binding protein